MKNLHELNSHRDTNAEMKIYGHLGDSVGGVFRVRCQTGVTVAVVASSGEGWDHVSVSLRSRCPIWDEMEEVKRLFFKDDETAVQLHVPPALHINVHPYCLHLWRPHGMTLPLPPVGMIR